MEKKFMKVSVVIPAYNATKTIQATLDSVQQQTIQPNEVIVFDDGSTDNTTEIVGSLGARVTLVRGQHEGVANARNVLCARAQGDLVAFLDSDDVWHPRYLETQMGLFQRYPTAVAYFTGHVDFYGEGPHKWDGNEIPDKSDIEIIRALDFLSRYNRIPGFFNMSFSCVPKCILNKLGSEPFKVSVAEDWYFFNCLAVIGTVAFDHTPLAAYRIRTGSLSSNRLRLSEAIVKACETIEPRFKALPDQRFHRAFQVAHSEKRRLYAKLLLDQCKLREAREQLKLSMECNSDPASRAKSIAILCSTYLPSRLQPNWLAAKPQWKGIAST
jgi:glycosyltransferase involved in cell wall biosynthesis